MHPRNLHNGRYDFEALINTSPELKTFVVPHVTGGLTINFDDPRAVRSLNKALLLHFYNVKDWTLPAQFLCPPIPGRADYIHTLADLFKKSRGLKGIDVGTGANCIYPLLGHRSYGWTFVATDIDQAALAAAAKILKANELEQVIELRQQMDAKKIFTGVIKAGEEFDFSLCNPPFHASLEDAQTGTERKRKNLGLSGKSKLNFGGKSNELWTQGGEREFILRMIMESSGIPESVTWFTSLVSKEANLPALEKKLKSIHCPHIRVLEMFHGKKKSRILAWSFKKELP